MSLPEFSPGVNPSFSLPSGFEWPHSVFSPTKPYDVVMPKSVQPVRSTTLKYILTKDQLDYTLSFFHAILGPAGVFTWRLTDAVYSPLHAGPTLDSVAGGALAQRTYYVQYAWFDSVSGEETKPSPASSITVAANYLLEVEVPYLPSGVQSWRVYASETLGDECLQATISNSRNWTEPGTGLVTLTSPPATVNTLKPLLKWKLDGMLEPEKVRAGRWRLEMQFKEVWVG